MIHNKKKYQTLILYICRKLGGELRGKKKLAKLLYFIDFDSYEKYHKSVTGDLYKALPMGPVPDSLNRISDQMQQDNMLTIEHVAEYDGYIPTETFTCLIEPDMTLISDEEKKIIDRAIKRYGHLSGKQLQDLSHAEAPYVATKAMDHIPYEFAYYRGTDFSDL